MDALYVLDLSAMESLNLLVDDDPDIIDKLDELVAAGGLLFCDEVRNECKKNLKKEPITIWAGPTSRSFNGRAAVAFQDCQEALGIAPEILVTSPKEPAEDSQALKTVALAYRLVQSSHVDVVVVTDEEISLEDRCTVSEACQLLTIQTLSVDSFVDEIDASLAA